MHLYSGHKRQEGQVTGAFNFASEATLVFVTVTGAQVVDNSLAVRHEFF